MTPKTVKQTYCNSLSAGPDAKTSLTAILGSPEAKCGLSLPPDTAIPNPYPGTRVTHICLYSHPRSWKKKQNFNDVAFKDDEKEILQRVSNFMQSRKDKELDFVASHYSYTILTRYSNSIIIFVLTCQQNEQRFDELFYLILLIFEICIPSSFS